MTELDIAKAWLRERPAEVKDVMLVFPPCCIVDVAPGADPFSEGFAGLKVISYTEDYELGVIIPHFPPPMTSRYLVPRDRASVVDYHENAWGEVQDLEWIRSVLYP